MNLNRKPCIPDGWSGTVRYSDEKESDSRDVVPIYEVSTSELNQSSVNESGPESEKVTVAVLEPKSVLSQSSDSSELPFSGLSDLAEQSLSDPAVNATSVVDDTEPTTNITISIVSESDINSETSMMILPSNMISFTVSNDQAVQQNPDQQTIQIVPSTATDQQTIQIVPSTATDQQTIQIVPSTATDQQTIQIVPSTATDQQTIQIVPSTATDQQTIQIVPSTATDQQTIQIVPSTATDQQTIQIVPSTATDQQTIQIVPSIADEPTVISSNQPETTPATDQKSVAIVPSSQLNTIEIVPQAMSCSGTNQIQIMTGDSNQVQVIDSSSIQVLKIIFYQLHIMFL